MINLPNVIFSLVMGFLMSASITFVTTFVHDGFTTNFLFTWLEVWSVAYPVAIVCILVYRPFASNLTEKIIKKIKSSQ
jgi:K+-sensing histidine kinase KdpD